MQHPGNVELALRIFTSAGLGGLIGLERELTDHPAGLRTHITVALGATLFGMVGSYGFGQFVGPGVTVAPDRVASTVVMGIGFLGGGAILKQGITVKGLTTAGSLWVTAAVGLGIGLGVYFITGLTVGLVLLSLVALRWPEEWMRRRRRRKETVRVSIRPGADRAAILHAIEDLAGLRVRSLSLQSEAGVDHFLVDLEGEPGVSIADAIRPLIEHTGVHEVELP